MVTTKPRRIVAAAVALLALGAALAAIWLAGTDGDAGSSGSARPARGETGVPAGPGADRAAATGAAGAAPVIVPGRPGEPARIAPGDEIAPVPARHNSMDVWFVRMMIPHHTQALQMAALAGQRAGDERVRALADRVRASQLPEIQALRGWLAARHLDPEDARLAHEHASMPGMQSATALRRLTDARGADFDRMFVEMLTAHHRGAITMATELLRVGIDTTVHEFANSIAIEQGVEIDRMRELLR